LPLEACVVLLSDVSVTHPKATRPGPLAGARTREQQKSRKYAAFQKPRQVAFKPFVLESTGAWGQAAGVVMKKLLHQQQDDDPEATEERRRDAYARVAVALHKGNALMARQCVESLVADFDACEELAPHRRAVPVLTHARRFGRGWHR
jgi:hypothetical protein